MLGLRERFAYLECGACGALQIGKVPPDLRRFYAPPYYSLEPAHPDPLPRRWLKRRWADHAMGARDPIGALVARVRGVPEVLRGVRLAGLDRDARVLDVGSGTGHTLLALRDYGFRRLLGVDPYIERDLYLGSGEVKRAALEDVDGTYDLVMFHHSLEHIADPATTLLAARERLAPGGRVLVRTPVASESWLRYGADWVELDAPRHLHVHTVRSLEILARGAGLELRDVRWETDAFELWGSEQYARDIPLTDPRSHFVSGGGRGQVFTRAEMRRFRARARRLNREGLAGRGAFWLAPA